MSSSMMIELIGYLGAVLIAISVLIPSVIRLRVFSLIGCIALLIYGVFIRSYPVVVLHSILTVVSIFHLIRLLATQRHFELVNMGKDSGVLEYFLTCYQEDIRKFFPEFQKNVTDFDTAYMVLSDTVPAGVLLGNLKEDGTLDVMLDYATPGYRDCSVGRFLYERLPERGVYRLLLRVRTNDLELYLQKMGFEKEDHHFVREL